MICQLFGGEVRGRGLVIGIEMVEDKENREPLNGDAVGGMIKKGPGRENSFGQALFVARA